MVRPSPTLGAVAAIVIAGLAVAGCAIPTQRVPSAIPPGRVPFGLLNHQLPTTTTTQINAAAQVKIFLLGPNHRLVEENRVVPVPAPLKSVVIQLLGGPLQKEAESAHVSTALPSSVHVISATLSKNPPLATVNFNDAFGQINGTSTELAVAQVVFTVVAATTLDTGVVFQVGGRTISVPVPGGQQVTGPVYLSQFAANEPQ
jgi:Sporulation and spore germination